MVWVEGVVAVVRGERAVAVGRAGEVESSSFKKKRNFNLARSCTTRMTKRHAHGRRAVEHMHAMLEKH